MIDQVDFNRVFLKHEGEQGGEPFGSIRLVLAGEDAMGSWPIRVRCMCPVSEPVDTNAPQSDCNTCGHLIERWFLKSEAESYAKQHDAKLALV
ncbi:MAG: hypothetical protein AABO41_22360 [Acidobacteriota bacterium]